MPELPTKLVDRLREAKASIWKMVHGDDAWSNCISISSVNLSKRDPFVADFRKNIQSKLVKLATEFVTKDNGVTRNSRNSQHSEGYYTKVKTEPVDDIELSQASEIERQYIDQPVQVLESDDKALLATAKAGHILITHDPNNLIDHDAYGLPRLDNQNERDAEMVNVCMKYQLAMKSMKDQISNLICENGKLQSLVSTLDAKNKRTCLISAIKQLE